MSGEHPGRCDVTVIIVTYNSAHVVTRAIAPLAGHPGIQFVVVDNASSDDSVDVVRSAVPDATVIENDDNVGFAKAVNAAAQHSRGRHLLLLNPDAAIDTAGLFALRDVAIDGGFAVVAPLLAAPGQSRGTVGAGWEPTARHIVAHASGAAALAARLGTGLRGLLLYAGPSTAGVLNVDWVTGGCMLVDREAWERVDGLTERWFMYAEDAEFCHRVRAAGYRVALCADVHAHHAIGGSSRGTDGKASTAWLENLFDYYVNSLPSTPASRLVWKWAMAAGYALRAGACALIGAGARCRGEAAHAALLASRRSHFSTYARASARL